MEANDCCSRGGFLLDRERNHLREDPRESDDVEPKGDQVKHAFGLLNLHDRAESPEVFCIAFILDRNCTCWVGDDGCIVQKSECI